MKSTPETGSIVSLQVLVDFDAQFVEIVFASSDKAMTVQLRGRGIIELKSEIDDLLDENPEILSWKSAPIH